MVGLKKLSTSSLRTSTPNLKAWLPLKYEKLSWTCQVLLLRNWGRLTARPIALRVDPALKPINPSSLISREGISSEEASDALVLVSRREKEKRASLTMLLESVLVSQAAAECCLETFRVVRPGGVTWPVPPVWSLLRR